MAQDVAALTQGRYGILIQRTYDSNVGAAMWNNANSFIPFNNLALYISPGQPQPACQPSTSRPECRAI